MHRLQKPSYSLWRAYTLGATLHRKIFVTQSSLFTYALKNIKQLLATATACTSFADTTNPSLFALIFPDISGPSFQPPENGLHRKKEASHDFPRHRHGARTPRGKISFILFNLGAVLETHSEGGFKGGRTGRETLQHRSLSPSLSI